MHLYVTFNFCLDFNCVIKFEGECIKTLTGHTGKLKLFFLNNPNNLLSFIDAYANILFI